MTIKTTTQNYLFCILISVFCVLLFAGCEEKKQIKTANEKPGILGQKAPEDNNSPKKLSAEIKQLKEQIETLTGIDKQARIEALSTISAIELTSRCGLYDKKNKDNKKETLVVYLKPIDDMGDCVKAAGAVEIQLWNLNAEPNEALLSKWEIEPKELKKNWSGSLLTSYYKLQFDVNSVLTGNKNEKELTLKAQFTDYLTGKILKAQRVVNNK
ncbi:MAG: hypothetical protein WC496_12300 [Phycisphaerae bacterium]|jgi:hypothetical protein